MKHFFFTAGLPRSGSTLLSAILNQNPDIYASSNSPVSGAMKNLKETVLLSEQYQAHPKPEALKATLLGVLENYYSDVDNKYIVDKSREWPTPDHLTTLLEVLPYKPKIIVTVRDILDVLASFINLVHENEGRQTMLDRSISTNDFHFYREPDDIRCDYLMHPKGVIDSALYGIANALMPENREYFHFIEYEDLVADPATEIKKVYEFLEIPEYEHSFKGIVNPVPENDEVYGLLGMHDVRPSVGKRKLNTDKLLSEYVRNKYSNLEFWRSK